MSTATTTETVRRATRHNDIALLGPNTVVEMRLEPGVGYQVELWAYGDFMTMLLDVQRYGTKVEALQRYFVLVDALNLAERVGE